MIKKGIICETLGSTEHLQINESKNGEVRLTGVFGVCGVKNNNNRVYEKKNYGDCVTEMQHRIMTEGVLGELEHPQSNNINLNNVSHKIESIEMNEDGTITGTILLLNTAKGRDAKAIVEGGVPLFISSRAAGSIDSRGIVTLAHIQTYDLVGTPGFSQARLDLKESQMGQTVSLNESAQGGNDMYMIVESEVNESGLDMPSDDDNKKDDAKKKEEKPTEAPTEKPTEAPTEKPTEAPKDDDDSKKEENQNNNDIINGMTDIQKSIDKLTDKISELEAQLHVANESLEAQADEINHLRENKVNYDAIQAWVTEEYGKKVKDMIAEANIDESKVQSIVKDYFIESIAPKVQDWITEEYSSEVKNTVKDYFIESLAPKVQDWVTEEYGSEVKNMIAESNIDENKVKDVVKDYFIESLAPKLQDWIVEEYSQTLDNFIKESQSELSEEITESLNERINEAKKEINTNVSEFLESQKRGQFDKFDTMLEKLSESSESAKFEALNSLNEGREDYANVYAVKNMPLQYQPMWESLSTEKRADVVRSSRMYNFSKPGVLESFWANQFKTGNVQNALINESLSQNKSVVNNRYAGLFARAKKMQLR